MDRKVAGKNVGTAAKHAYEASVKARALQRAGHCRNLNGHILEIMGGDKTNRLSGPGIRETLTRSRTATTVDAVVKMDGQVIHRIQYKDTARSIGDTVRRVRSGQYRSATLKGTTETAEAFNRYAAKHGIAKRMHDTGISSRTTKTLARSCGAARQISVGRAAAMAAKSGGAVGAVFSGGISAISNTVAVINGEKDFGEAVCCVAKDSAGGALAGAGSAAAAISIREVSVSTASSSGLASIAAISSSDRKSSARKPIALVSRTDRTN